MKTSKSGGLKDTIWTFFWAIGIAVVVRTFAFEPFNIPSSSMVPTLLVGDYLFVSKYSYGYSRHSFPWSLPPFEGRVFGRMPKRGDVAVFKRPPADEVDFIKRLIGLPGDRIQMIDGQLHINGEIVPREQTADYEMLTKSGRLLRVAQYDETLPNLVVHKIIEMHGDQGPVDTTEELVVPEGHFLAMGDNRDNSADGRGDGDVFSAWFVPAENLVGRAEFLFFSTDGTCPLYGVWCWPTATRWDRIFDGVH